MVDFDLVNVAINGVFGESLLYQPASGAAAFTIQGVFTDAYKIPYENGADGGPGWTLTAPSVGIRAADLPSPAAKNDGIVRLKNGLRYLLMDSRSDGMGWLNIILKVSA